METMTLTRLEKEQNYKLCELSASIATLQEALKHERETTKNLREEREKLRKEMQSHNDMAIAQLRDQLHKCQVDLSNSQIGVEAHRNDSKQLRDELAKLTERAERAEKDLRVYTKQASEMTVKANKLMQQRDEALAKQPGMIMNEGGKLWEVFRISDDEQRDYDWEYYLISEQAWKVCGPFCLWECDFLYRRPITPDQLRTWLPSAPPEQPGDVLFSGVRWVTDYAFQFDRVLFAKSGKKAMYPVYVTIRKAGA